MAGRPRKLIDMGELGKLAAMQCTLDEAAHWFGCGVATIKRRMTEPAFRAVWDEGKGKGQISLRRLQFKHAETNPGMAIFLGKNYLGQSDRQELGHTGTVTVLTGVPARGNGD